MIKFSEWVHLNLDNNVLSIKNLNLTDTNVYRCVSPENGFYTNLVVVKNYRKKSKKVVPIHSH